jgi:methyl-accepting chemotaxis protein
MFMLFKSAMVKKRGEKAREIKGSLAERWDLDSAFSLPGDGPANFIIDALNHVFRRLTAFVCDLTKRNVAMATVAPLALAISRKVRQSSESLSQRAEQLEQTCHQLAEGISTSAESANQALAQSASIVSEITRAGDLTGDALQRMQVMEQNVGQLSSAIAALDQKSRSIGSIIETISDVADKTGLLSLNAFIEAARAGAQGAGFGVIAQEVRQLSQETARAAQEVKDSLLTISGLIQDTVTAVAQAREGVDAGMQVNQEASAALEKVSREHHRFHLHLESVISGVSDQNKAVTLFADELSTISTIGKEGKIDSAQLAELAETVKVLTEEQLLSSGLFILPQYRKAEAEVLAMATDPDICTAGIAADQALQRRMQPLAYLELMYLTNPEGIQVSSNVFRKDQATVSDASAKGKNWSQKMWFRKVKETGKPYISEIYRSEATNSFCLTISVPVYRQSAWVGVLGADISFADLLNI